MKTNCSQQRIPILMYHAIANVDESCIHPYYRTATSPELFREHIQVLHERGYTTIGLPEVANRVNATGRTQKTVCITFDDGYADFQQHAFPLLEQFGFKATVFLPTAFVGDSPRQFKERDILTWRAVRELQRAGMRFGSHTVSHPQLRALPYTEIKREISDSRRELEDRLGTEIDSFAYPYAFPEEDTDFKRILRELLEGASYRYGVCTTVGCAGKKADSYFMPRLPINCCDDRDLFEAKLAGAYDWIGTLQLIYKVLKRISHMTASQKGLSRKGVPSPDDEMRTSS
jgi:peptidoglycan/xylan/chitin deacetylase (PgdA/CDA1 family)